VAAVAAVVVVVDRAVRSAGNSVSRLSEYRGRSDAAPVVSAFGNILSIRVYASPGFAYNRAPRRGHVGLMRRLEECGPS
jgi:hypothetical protein